MPCGCSPKSSKSSVVLPFLYLLVHSLHVDVCFIFINCCLLILCCCDYMTILGNVLSCSLLLNGISSSHCSDDGYKILSQMQQTDDGLTLNF